MFLGKLAIVVAGHILSTGCLRCATTLGGAEWSEEQRTVCTSWCVGGCQCEVTDSNPVLCGDHSHNKSPMHPEIQARVLGL